MTTITSRYGIALCVDCYMDAAGVHEDPESVEPRPLSRMPKGWARTADIVCVDYEPHFSWHPCQGCGSTLGGDRMDCEVVHFGYDGRYCNETCPPDCHHALIWEKEHETHE